MNKSKIIICFIVIIIATVLYMIFFDEILFRNKEIPNRGEIYSLDVLSMEVMLLENGNIIAKSNDDVALSTGELLANLSGNTGESNIIPGKIYKEELEIKNSGTINQYARVTIYRYWTDEEGNKVGNLVPENIDLKLTQQEDWFVDEAAATKEKTVIYYTKLIPAGESVKFSETFRILPSASTDMNITATKSGENTIINTKRTYDGYKAYLEVKVDTVQEHSAQNAIWEAWGKQVVVLSDGTLSFE